MSGNSKRDSLLVSSVVSLQHYLAELERIGAKIIATDMTSDIDVEYVQKLLQRFAESGDRVAQELNSFSGHLQLAQARAESIAQEVSWQTEAFDSRRKEQSEHLERFHALGERVRELNAKISSISPPSAQGTVEEHAGLRSALPELGRELEILIGELDDLRVSARDSRMSGLEKSAQSLAQTLQAVHARLRSLMTGRP